MTSISKLYLILLEEVENIDTLIRLMKAKKDAIISLTYDRLKDLVTEEIKLVNMTKKLEKERITLLKESSFSLPNVEKATMSEIIEKLDAEESVRFMELKNRFRKSIDELKMINDTNSILIDRGKRFIKENISILTSNGTRRIINTKI
jgi:hypothetical protein